MFRHGHQGSGRGGATLREHHVRADLEPQLELADEGGEGATPVTTTWTTPTGWAMVRDALTMGPRSGEDTVTPHTRPPADFDGDHMPVRTILCLDGTVEMELVCEPDVDYGRVPAEWSLSYGERHTADVVGGELTLRLQTDRALGIEGN